MLEVAPSVYLSPSMTRGVRERTWNVLSKWFGETTDSSIVMIYKDSEAPAGVGVASLGEPPRQIVEIDGVALSYLNRKN